MGAYYLGSTAVARLYLGGALVWQPTAVAPTVALTSGQGYAGSVYTASAPSGQWYADGAAIAGATGQTLTTTPAMEGAAITFSDGARMSSPSPRVWTPGHIPRLSRGHAGWWPLDRGVTLNAGKVERVADQFGVRDLVQATAANRPSLSTVNGRSVMTWPNTTNDMHLATEAVWAPVYICAAMQYRTGTEAAFGGYNTLWGSMPYNSAQRTLGDSAKATLFASTWIAGIAKNAGAYSTTALPMPLSVVEIYATTGQAIGQRGRWGPSAPQSGRGWNGHIGEILALGFVPDGDLLARIQGYMAWKHGLAASLPEGHAYKSAPPMTTAPLATGIIPYDTIQVAGASIEAGAFGEPNNAKAHPGASAEFAKAGMPGVLVFSQAASGNKVADQTARYNTVIAPLMTDRTLMYLAISGNDLVDVSKTWYTITQAERDTFLADYDAWFAAAAAHIPRHIVAHLSWRNYDQLDIPGRVTSGYDDAIHARVKAMATLTYAHGGQRSLMDLWRQFRSTRDWSFLDGAHQNEAGSQRYREFLVERIGWLIDGSAPPADLPAPVA